MKKVLILLLFISFKMFGQSVTISPIGSNILIEKTNGIAEQTIRGISGQANLNLEAGFPPFTPEITTQTKSSINFRALNANQFSITNYLNILPLSFFSGLYIEKNGVELASFDTPGMTIPENKGIGFGISPKFPITMNANLGDKISLGGIAHGLIPGPHNGMGLQNNLFQIFSKSNTDDIAFGYGESTAFTENMRIKGNGKVGFGNSTPNLNSDERMEINGRLRIRDSTSTAGIWFNNTSNSKLLTDGAFVGLKNNTESGFWIGNAWRFWVNNLGNATLTGTLTQSSDKRLKKDISPLTNSLSNIYKLNGYHYKWIKESRSKDLQTGLIAQEVQKIFPELTQTDEKGFLSVNYIGLVPHLIEAVKDLRDENNSLKLKNQTLETKNQTLESRLDKIEAMLSTIQPNTENLNSKK